MLRKQTDSVVFFEYLYITQFSLILFILLVHFIILFYFTDQKYISDCEFTGECMDSPFRVATFLTG